MAAAGKIDLTDPQVDPNPSLKKAVDLGNELFHLGMRAPEGVASHYILASDMMAQVVGELMAAKNAIAESQGEQ